MERDDFVEGAVIVLLEHNDYEILGVKFGRTADNESCGVININTFGAPSLTIECFACDVYPIDLLELRKLLDQLELEREMKACTTEELCCIY